MSAGVDLFGKYNGVTNWSAVRAAGITFAILKLTNGVSKAAPTGDVFAAGARSVGIAVGGYAYAMEAHSPAGQAAALAAELKRLNAFGVAPALDYEDKGLPTEAGAARMWILQFFSALKSVLPELTVVLLYASGELMKAIDPVTLTVPGLLILTWDAEYGANDGAEHARTHYTAPVAVHQYTSVGHVPGITGGVDRNTLYDTRVLHPIAATTQEDDVTAADVWNYPLPNPNYDSTNPNSKPTYTAAELLAGTYGTELAVDAHLTLDNAAMLAAMTTAQSTPVTVTLTPEQVAQLADPITAALATLPDAVKKAIGQALTA